MNWFCKMLRAFADSVITNSDETDDKVLRYDKQSLTEEEKAQARENIGAAAISTNKITAAEIVEMFES